MLFPSNASKRQNKAKGENFMAKNVHSITIHDILNELTDKKRAEITTLMERSMCELERSQVDWPEFKVLAFWKNVVAEMFRKAKIEYVLGVAYSIDNAPLDVSIAFIKGNKPSVSTTKVSHTEAMAIVTIPQKEWEQLLEQK